MVVIYFPPFYMPNLSTDNVEMFAVLAIDKYDEQRRFVDVMFWNQVLSLLTMKYGVQWPSVEDAKEWQKNNED